MSVSVLITSPNTITSQNNSRKIKRKILLIFPNKEDCHDYTRQLCQGSLRSSLEIYAILDLKKSLDFFKEKPDIDVIAVGEGFSEQTPCWLINELKPIFFGCLLQKKVSVSEYDCRVDATFDSPESLSVEVRKYFEGMGFL